MELVLFDLDGTLLDHDRAEADAIARLIDAEGWPTDVDCVSTCVLWHSISEDAHARHRAGVLTSSGQRRVRVSRFLEALGVAQTSDSELDRLFDRYHAGYEVGWAAFPDVLPCLEVIRANHRIAVLSNGELSEKAAKVRRIGLSPYVEAILVSVDLGAAKPHPLAFRRAVDVLGVAARDVVYVGDRLDVDALAATAAGLHGVWLDRHGHRSTTAGVPSIRTLDELPTQLACLGAARQVVITSTRG